MARQAKKTPYQVGNDVWVKAKVTRVVPHPRLKEITQITVELPSGHLDTMGLNADKVKPVDG